MKKIKIFISSVLKELMNERLAVLEAIADSEFLSRYFEVEMWEGSTRQRDTLKNILKDAMITSEECTKTFEITRDTANRDFKRLMELELIEQKGAGRATHYVLKE